MRGWHRLLWGWLGTFLRLAWASEGGWLEPLKVAGNLLETGLGLLQGGKGLLEPSSGLWQLCAARVLEWDLQGWLIASQVGL